jgi:hypothetical protein
MKSLANYLTKHLKTLVQAFIIVILLMPLLLSACSSAESLPTIMPLPTSQQNAGYPAPQTNDTGNPSYPCPPSPNRNNPGPTEAIDPKMGIIKGILLRNNVPVPEISLYLADVMKDNNGNDIVAGLDLTNAETTTTGLDGSFTFTNIKPDRYALILDIVTQQFLLSYPDKKDAIIMQVEAGKEINLGELNYDELPLP